VFLDLWSYQSLPLLSHGLFLFLPNLPLLPFIRTPFLYLGPPQIHNDLISRPFSKSGHMHGVQVDRPYNPLQSHTVVSPHCRCLWSLWCEVTKSVTHLLFRGALPFPVALLTAKLLTPSSAACLQTFFIPPIPKVSKMPECPEAKGVTHSEEMARHSRGHTLPKRDTPHTHWVLGRSSGHSLARNIEEVMANPHLQ
jgi:hypothetical protein